MPSKSPAQARLMRAAAHTPGGFGGVSQKVGREFVDADKKQAIATHYEDGGLPPLRRGPWVEPGVRTYPLLGPSDPMSENVEDRRPIMGYPRPRSRTEPQPMSAENYEADIDDQSRQYVRDRMRDSLMRREGQLGDPRDMPIEDEDPSS